ncbi:hypothetical protein KCTCHS21_29950 [Cohnella abietis]|uniref:Uncharacterized protein n=1 Tax=Cohnella abietis TaxID=2507935 RepID=A0A3T1D691_9BACL|nr:hypothetical protein KCTCHS21_29950 [Cohnella abietis]
MIKQDEKTYFFLAIKYSTRYSTVGSNENYINNLTNAITLPHITIEW